MSIEDVVVTSDLGVVRRLALVLADDLPRESDQDGPLDAAIRRAASPPSSDEQEDVPAFQSAS
jgi:hypothetical protein